MALTSFLKASKDSWILLSLPVGDTGRHEGEEGLGGGWASVPAWGGGAQHPVGVHQGGRRAAAGQGALPEDETLARDTGWHPSRSEEQEGTAGTRLPSTALGRGLSPLD